MADAPGRRHRISNRHAVGSVDDDAAIEQTQKNGVLRQHCLQCLRLLQQRRRELAPHQFQRGQPVAELPVHLPSHLGRDRKLLLAQKASHVLAQDDPL